MPRQKVNDLKEEMKDISMKVKIVSISSRNTRNERGESTYFYGYMGDETGTIPYTAWAFPSSLKAGDVVDMKNVYTKKYNDTIRVYLDSRSEIILDPSTNLEVKRVYREYKIKDLSLKDQYVDVRGIASSVRAREYEKDGKKQKVYQGFLEDETARVRISSFGREIVENKPLKLVGARVTEFNGRISLSVNDKTGIDSAEEIKIPQYRIYQLQEINGPVGGITIAGFVVSVGEKSGVIYRCAECSKTISDGSCPDHPDARKVEDIFAYFTIDDGTGVMQCSAGSDHLLSFLKIGKEALTNADAKSRDEIHASIRNSLLGMPIFASGEFRRLRDDLSFRIDSMKRVDQQELKIIAAAMEADL
ncbi:mjaSSB [Thermoplasmatales archaeon]|nr:mjaSSB [Thermoplasmatales archaeon]